MEENKSKKKQVNKKVIIPIMGIIIAIIAVGASFAVWNYAFNGQLTNTISTNDISLDLLESNENIINIENALPMGCADGKSQTETFDFAVTSKTTKDTKINYTISIQKLEVDNGYTALNDNQIALYLTDFNNTELLPSNYSSDIGCVSNQMQYCAVSGVCFDTIAECHDFDKGKTQCSEENRVLPVSGVSLISQLNNYKLYSGTHKHNATHNVVQDKFKLRAWIAGDVDASNWNASTKLQYKFKIGLTSEEKEKGVYPEYVYRYGANSVRIGDPLEATTMQGYCEVNTNEGYNSCTTDNLGFTEQQDCLSDIDGWDGTICSPGSWTVGVGTYTEDYTTLNKTYFLGHKIGNDGKVERNDACFIRNNTLYCLKGVETANAGYDENNPAPYYGENYNTLLEAFGPNAIENNVCSVYGYGIYCSASGLGAYAYVSGGVGANGGSTDCSAGDNGGSVCYE